MRRAWKIVAMILLPALAAGSLLMATQDDEASAQGVSAAAAVEAYMGAQGGVTAEVFVYPPRVNTPGERERYRNDYALAGYICYSEVQKGPLRQFKQCIDWSLATERFSRVQLAARIYHAIEFWMWARVDAWRRNQILLYTEVYRVIAQAWVWAVGTAAYHAAQVTVCGGATRINPYAGLACAWIWASVEDANDGHNR